MLSRIIESFNGHLQLPSEVLQPRVMWESPHLPPSLRILCSESQTASCQPADKFTAALRPCEACFPCVADHPTPGSCGAILPSPMGRSLSTREPRVGSPGKGELIQFSTVRKQILPRPQTQISLTLLCFVVWDFTLLHFLIAFEQEFQGVSPSEAPLHWVKEASSCFCDPLSHSLSPHL